MPDIDLDVPSSVNPLHLFPEWVRASMVRNGTLTPHPCGVHPVTVEKDPITGLSAIPYQEAEALGIQKLDFLHLHFYNVFQSREEIVALLDVDPPWELLKSPAVCGKLFQNLGKHFDLVNKVQPKSVEELADVLALIRPGRRYLLDYYLNPNKRAEVRRRLYEKSENDSGYHYKKSHSIAYSLVIVLQLHLVAAGIEF
jgi:DNA polymerase III alpha subunit